MRPIDFNEIVAFKSNAKVRAEISGISYYPRHSHYMVTEIICVLNGSVTVIDGAMKYELTKNDLHIFNSGDPHQIYSDDPNSTVLLVQFDKTQYAHKFKGLEKAWYCIHSYDSSDQYLAETRYLRHLLAYIYIEHAKREPSVIHLEQKTEELIQLLYDYFHRHEYCSNPLGGFAIIRKKNAFKADDDFERVYVIEDYIEDHFREKPTLAEIAEMEHFNKTYLSRFIKDNIGVTFSEMFSIVRCSEAERLLASTTMSVEDIARDVGFSNRSHLTKQFLKWYNITPSAYRNNVFRDFTGTETIRYHDIQKDSAEDVIYEYLNG